MHKISNEAQVFSEHRLGGLAGTQSNLVLLQTQGNLETAIFQGPQSSACLRGRVPLRHSVFQPEVDQTTH